MKQRILLFAIFLYCAQGWAITKTVDVTADFDPGNRYPVSVDVTSGRDGSAAYISVAGTVQPSPEVEVAAPSQSLSSKIFDWSYHRGVGKLPAACDQGFDPVLGVCAEICPAGYDAAVGGCWQTCPAGFTDVGAYCVNWRAFDVRSKEVLPQAISALQCAEGLVNEAGLCYTPCADGFAGVGPVCFGSFNTSATRERFETQIASQHAVAAELRNDGGITIADNIAPQLRSTVVVADVVCQLDAVTTTFGFLPNPIDEVNTVINDAINDGLNDLAGSLEASTDGVWFIPSIADTVLFDFSAETSCLEDGSITTAGINANIGITTQVNSRMFDSALHNLAGVDLGLMAVSVYELIPFRLYGTVGATLETPIAFSSTIDADMPALYIDNQAYATATSIAVNPSLNLWLSAQAYLRVTSLFDFIPDLMQLGADVYVDVLDVSMPYSLTESVQYHAGGYSLNREESLVSDLATGFGYVDIFLRVLGMDIEVDALNAGDTRWQGYSQQDVLVLNQSTTPLAL